FRMIRACYAKDFGARREALLELVRKGGERGFVEPECAKAVPGEGQSDPPGVWRVSADRICSSNFVDQTGQPGAARGRVPKGEELVARGERRRACQKEVLNVVRFQRV